VSLFKLPPRQGSQRKHNSSERGVSTWRYIRMALYDEIIILGSRKTGMHIFVDKRAGKPPRWFHLAARFAPVLLGPGTVEVTDFRVRFQP